MLLICMYLRATYKFSSSSCISASAVPVIKEICEQPYIRLRNSVLNVNMCLCMCSFDVRNVAVLFVGAIQFTHKNTHINHRRTRTEITPHSLASFAAFKQQSCCLIICRLHHTKCVKSPLLSLSRFFGFLLSVRACNNWIVVAICSEFAVQC